MSFDWEHCFFCERLVEEHANCERCEGRVCEDCTQGDEDGKSYCPECFQKLVGKAL